jgi:hypothetical protein
LRFYAITATNHWPPYNTAPEPSSRANCSAVK